jgi:hypothetical protein
MSQMVRDKFISLFERRPDLLSEWHPAKNGDIRPEDISFGSGRKIWWQCSQGHEWQAVECVAMDVQHVPCAIGDDAEGDLILVL